MNKRGWYIEQLKFFDDFKFYSKDHHYEYKGQLVGMSVTRLIDEYTNEFKSEFIAEKVANKEGKTTQEVLDEWKYKADFAKEKGSFCHEYAQALWNKSTNINTRISKEFYSKSNDEKVKKILVQADNFYNDYKNSLEHLADEFIIGSSEFDIASAIDHLFINKMSDELVMVDYKTNSDIHKNERYAKKMKAPLNHLKDDTLTHYAIQLSIYKYLIEKYTNLKINEFFIVWFSELNEKYEIIEVPYLKNEVIKILENRRVKDMDSVPVLLIGKSGTGKSASLRNFKKDEIAIANVLGKPLPFQNDFNAPLAEDYKVILNSINSTDKKTIVVDDAGYLLTNAFMRKASIKGYDKYNEMANDFFEFINGIKKIKGNKTVYIIMHEDADDLGNIKPKTIGKLLDEKVNIQGMFTVCIRSVFNDGKYLFRVKTNGQDCVKTPIGMFEEDEIENDLKLVDKKIREFYNLDKKESEK